MPDNIVLETEVLDKIMAILHEIVPESVIIYLFGSRATGKARPYSDVDIALNHDGHPISAEIMEKIRVGFEFSDLPYKVDIVDLSAISDSFHTSIQSELVKLS